VGAYFNKLKALALELVCPVSIKTVSVQMVKIEANFWLFWDGTRFPFTAWRSSEVSHRTPLSTGGLLPYCLHSVVM